MATVNGTNGNDFIHVAGDGLPLPAGFTDNPGATNGDDTIFSGIGGRDIIHAGDGADAIFVDSALNASGVIDGGAGNDTLFLFGPINAVFGAGQLANIEAISLNSVATGAHSVTMNDANVAAGRDLTIDASAYGSNTSLNLDYSAETDAHKIAAVGGDGNDVIHGRLVNSDGSVDAVDLSRGGNDTFVGVANVNFGVQLTSADRVDGLDASLVRVNGDYSAGLTLTGAMLQDVPFFEIGPAEATAGANFDYRFTTTDDLVAADGSMIFRASFVPAGNSVFIDASAETDGAVSMLGGAGNDTFIGGGKNDVFVITNGGNDTVAGTAATISSSAETASLRPTE